MWGLSFPSVKWVLLSKGNSNLPLRGLVNKNTKEVNILHLYSEIKLMFYMCILHMLTTPDIYKYIKSHTEWNLEHTDQSKLWVFLPRNRYD